ncbi:MAG: serine hydrolase domain-containing protein [Bacteroidota bacterium]|jgi:CubicO group peptidase (beta-lactamase class C family)
MKTISKTIFLLFVALVVTSSISYGQFDTIAFIKNEKAKIIKDLKDTDIKGFAIAFFDTNKVIWSEGWGHLNNENDSLVNDKSIFAIHSASKTFTATAVMFAVQDGLVDLDTPIIKYLPTFKVNSCFENNPETKITLRYLLGHAAGFTHEAPIGNNYDASCPDNESHNKSIQTTWLRCRVGSEYHYSNLGIDLAAQILEKVTGTPFYEYLKQKIFVPLQMNSTTANPDELVNNQNKAEGNLYALASLPYKVPFIGAGGVYTNAEDLAKFVQFHLNLGKVNGKQLLDYKYLYEMYTPIIVNNYALGICLSVRKDMYGLFHNGSGFGFGSSMMWFPEYGIGCIALGNYQVECLLEKYVGWVLNDYVKENKLQKIQISHPFDPSRALEIQQSGNSVNCVTVCYRPMENTNKSDTVTYKWKDIRFKNEWEKYTGTYLIEMGGGFEFKWYGKIGRLLKIFPRIHVYEKDGCFYLKENPTGLKYLNEVQLFEYLPGLFFTSEGEALDFRGNTKSYRNLKLE